VTAARSIARRGLARVSAPSVPAGIYGTIICASILASAEHQSAAKTAIVVVITLFVYWMAERYSEVLGLVAPHQNGERRGTGDGSVTDDGGEAGGGGAAPDGGVGGNADHPGLTGDHVRRVLRSGWPMIQASITPLVVLWLSRLFGASNDVAIDIALAYTLVLLTLLGWLAATRARLTGWQRLIATAFATILGLVVVALKASLH
jgi:hypothetical protein